MVASKLFSAVLMSVILLAATITSSVFILQDSDAMQSSGTPISKVGSKDVCGDRLCSEWEGGREGYEKSTKKAIESIEKTIKEIERAETTGGKKMTTESDKLKKELEQILDKIERGERLSKGEIIIAKKTMMESSSLKTHEEIYGGTEGEAKGAKSFLGHAFGNVESGTVTSIQDPGLGHESHQLAVILPPSDKVYVGKITFSASEPVQYVTIHGPLSSEDIGGQPVWSPNEDTHYALTLVDNKQKSGGWYFAGNALALHSMHNTPFTASYSVSYAEIDPGVYPQGTVKTGTVRSIQDPGIGHEDHSIALILPPRDIPYQGGVIAYTASENVQLVALIGPLSEDEIHGQTIWTPDGKIKYALTLVEGGTMGVWNTFSGNALALHTINPDGFTASYTIAGLH